MIRLYDAKRIVELRERLDNLKLSMAELESFKVAHGTISLSGTRSGYSENGKFKTVVKGEVARGMVRAALQLQIDQVLRDLRGLNAEIPE